MRKLSAIMFTDMVGYTALMQQDERRATELRDRHRTVLRETIESHAGEIVQFYGDGTLSVFPSAVRSVEAAIEIQSRFRTDPVIPVRIGLHVGDVVHDEDGIHGDGVNVAARVEGLGIPGAIMISERVRKELANHPRFEVVDLGRFALKNVSAPMAIAAVVAPTVIVPTPAELGTAAVTSTKSIAVLPFASFSPNPDDEYFADGVTEEILNALAQFDGLKVTARTSAFAFKGRHTDVREIGRMLGVGFVLEGSLRKSGDRVRITAQLIDTADGYHLFSNTYDRVVDDIFEAQDDIARTIAGELRVLLPTGGDAGPVVRPPTSDPDAYDAYLRGLHAWNQWTPDASRRALDHFRAATRHDPDFALAYTGVSRCLAHLGALGRLAKSDMYEEMDAAVRRAISLDPNNAECLAAQASMKLFYDLDLSGAKRAFDRAVAVSPGIAETHHFRSYYFMAVGDHEAMVEAAETAAHLDPLSPVMLNQLGRVLAMAGRPAEAIPVFERALEVNADFRAAVEGLSVAHDMLGNHAQAVELAERFRSMTPGQTGGVAPLVRAYSGAGNTERAEHYLATLEERARTDLEGEHNLELSTCYVALGRIDEAIECIRRAVEGGEGGLIFVRYAPPWRGLSGHPRFEEIMAPLGL